MTLFLKQLYILGCCIILSAFITANAHSKNVSNGILLDSIEKSLLFSKDQVQEADFYRKKSLRQSEITVDRSQSDPGNTDNQSRSAVEVLVVDSDGMKDSMQENVAYNAMLIGQYEVAIAIYKDLIEKRPNNDYAKFSLAVAYQMLNQNSQAKDIYHELLESVPDNKEQIVSNLLSILVSESPKEAIYFLTRLATQNPSSSYIMAQLSLAYEKVRDYEQSVNFLKKAINLDHENLEYIYNLAVIYDKMNERSQAIRGYTQVVRNYNNDYAKSISLPSVENRLKTLKALR